MRMIRERLPSFADFLGVSGLTVLIAYSWALLGVFNKLSSWILMFSLPEMLAMLAYVLLVALVDTLLVMCVVLLISFLSPGHWIRADFVARGGMLVIILMGAPVLFHFMGQNFYEVSNAIILVGVILVLVLAACLFMLLRIPLFRRAICFLVERSSIFLYIYLPLTLLALLFLLFRTP